MVCINAIVAAFRSSLVAGTLNLGLPAEIEFPLCGNRVIPIRLWLTEQCDCAIEEHCKNHHPTKPLHSIIGGKLK